MNGITTNLRRTPEMSAVLHNNGKLEFFIKENEMISIMVIKNRKIKSHSFNILSITE